MNGVLHMGIAERKLREKQELRREILDAARELFVREGYGSVTVRQIAEEVERAPGTIYLYFKDKAELLETLCEETFAKLDKKLQPLRIYEGDPREALRKGLRWYIEFGLEHPSDYIVTFIWRAERSLPAGLRTFENLRHCVRRVAEAGYLAGNDVEAFSQALWAGIHGVTSLLITRQGFPFIGRERLIEQVLDMLLQGVLKREERKTKRGSS
jgi:AcrR family transcriptional regulator